MAHLKTNMATVAAQEADSLSDIDFEDDSDEEMEGIEDDPPNKKRKA